MQDYNMGHVTHFHGRTGLSGVTDFGESSESVSAEQYYCTTFNEDFGQVSGLFEDDGNVELFMTSNITHNHDYDDKGIFEFDFTTFDATADYNFKEPFAAKDISINPVENMTIYKENGISYENSKIIEDNSLLFEMGTPKEPQQEIKLCDKQRLEDTNSSIVIEISSTHNNLHTNSNCESECVSNFSDCVSLNPLQQFEIKRTETHSNHTEFVPAEISKADATVFAPTIADKVKRGRKQKSDINSYHEISMIIQQNEKRRRRKKKTTDMNKTHEPTLGNNTKGDSSSYISESNNLNKDKLNQIERFVSDPENIATDSSCQSFQSKMEKSNVSIGELPFKNMCVKTSYFDYIKNNFSLISCRNESSEHSLNDQSVKSLNTSHSPPIIEGLSAHAMSTYNSGSCLEDIPKMASDQSGRILCEEFSSSNVSSSLYGCSVSKLLEPVEISTPELEIECHVSSNPEITYLEADFGEPNIDIKSGTSSISFMKSQEKSFEKILSSIISSKTSAVHSCDTSASSADSKSLYDDSTRDMCDSKSPTSSTNSLKASRLTASSGDKSNRCATNSITENLHHSSVSGIRVDKDEHHQNTKRKPRSRSRSPHTQNCDLKDLQSQQSSHHHSDYRKSRSRSRSRGRKYSPKERSPSSRKNKYHRDHYKAIEERRIIYVGNIPEGYTVDQLKSRFQYFGPIIDAQIKSKNENSREKSIFGFITFQNRRDAYNAFERGNKEPLWPKFDINFGGRRRFCNGDYTDLDGRVAERENVWYSQLNNTCEQSGGDDFAALLKAEEMRLGIKRSLHKK